MSSVRRSVLMYGLPLLLVLGMAIWWLSRPAATASPPTAAQPVPVQVRSTLVRAQDMPIRLTGLGAVQAWASVLVRARIDGQLESVGFQEGEIVHKGQLIAQLDDRMQKAQLAQATAQLARDQAQLSNAQVDLKRYVELARHAAIDRQTLDTQRAQVTGLQATLQFDEAQIQSARVQLDYTRITAPVTGRTGARLVDPGNLVRAADAQGLVLINQIDPIAVSFTVSDTAFPLVHAAVQAGKPLVVEVYGRDSAGQQDPQAVRDTGADQDTRADRNVETDRSTETVQDTDTHPDQRTTRGFEQALARGTLVLVDNQIDAASATLRLKARFDNAAQTLWPGQAVDVRLILGTRPGALVVPDAAVQRGADGLYVYVVQDDDRVRTQAVQVLVSQDGLSVVSQGLSAGQRVVVTGQYKLRPGIRVIEAHTAGAAAAPAVSSAAAPLAAAGHTPLAHASGRRGSRAAGALS